MTAGVHNLPIPPISQLLRMLDEAEVDRARVTRRIKHLRTAVKAVESGEPVPDLEVLLADLNPVGASASFAPSAPPSVSPFAQPPASFAQAPAAFAQAPAAFAPAPSSPIAFPGGATDELFAGHLGLGLPPGVLAPVPPPPPGAELALPSVDVGRLGRLSPEELDRLPFGVVTVDANGRILGYNDTESRLAGLPRDHVIGRHFFREVAPCAAVQEFEGRFRDFAAGRSRVAVESFEFVFNFRKGAQRVVILVSPARLRGRFHVSMVRR